MTLEETALVGSEYAIEHGFIGYGTDPHSNFTYLSVYDLLPNPIQRHMEISGWGGWGMDFTRLLQLWPLFGWAIIFYFLRPLFYPLFRRFAIFCGIPEKSRLKLGKFQYQSWLLLYYALSTLFGAYVLSDKPWVGFPMNSTQMMNLFINHPHSPDQMLVHYYSYEMGFYLAELFVIFKETRRSDFIEYVAHHLTTILLMVFSFAGFEHRIGSYILIIHDISDVFLCFTKLLHYLKLREWLVNASFGLFIFAFFWTRLVCLPVHGFAVLFVATAKRICTVNFWIMAILLQFVLQALHVYWFALIMKIVYRILFSTYRGDIRSDSDEEPVEDKLVLEKKKKNKKHQSKVSKLSLHRQ